MRSVSDQRLSHLGHSVPTMVSIFEVANVLVDQARLLVISIPVLEHLSVFSNLYIELIIVLSAFFAATHIRILPFELNIDDSLVFLSLLLACEVIDFCWLEDEGALVLLAGLAGGRD